MSVTTAWRQCQDEDWPVKDQDQPLRRRRVSHEEFATMGSVVERARRGGASEDQIGNALGVSAPVVAYHFGLRRDGRADDRPIDAHRAAQRALPKSSSPSATERVQAGVDLDVRADLEELRKSFTMPASTKGRSSRTWAFVAYILKQLQSSELKWGHYSVEMRRGIVLLATWEHAHHIAHDVARKSAGADADDIEHSIRMRTWRCADSLDLGRSFEEVASMLQIVISGGVLDALQFGLPFTRRVRRLRKRYLQWSTHEGERLGRDLTEMERRDLASRVTPRHAGHQVVLKVLYGEDWSAYQDACTPSDREDQNDPVVEREDHARVGDLLREFGNTELVDSIKNFLLDPTADAIFSSQDFLDQLATLGDYAMSMGISSEAVGNYLKTL